jgi:hypothetical protein
MRRGMLLVVPGMNVKVETVVTRSLNKADLDPRYLPEAQPQAPPVVSDPTGEVAESATGVGSPATSATIKTGHPHATQRRTAISPARRALPAADPRRRRLSSATASLSPAR